MGALQGDGRVQEERGDGMSRVLKPCPFCGGKAVLKETYKYIGLGKSIPQYYVKCGNSECCLYVATCNRDTEEEAVEIWNMREGDRWKVSTHSE